MKSFIQYLTESRKQFKFTIKLAFKPSSDQVDKIEKALDKFDLVSLSSAKSLPIKKVDPHFPKISSPETYALETVVNYPASAFMIQNVLKQLGMDTESVAVVGTDHDISVAGDEDTREKNLEDAPLLLRELEPGNSKANELSGDDYNKKLVKNSLTKKIKVGNTPPAKTTNDFPMGDTSPVGSTKNKLPKVVSSAR